MVLEWSDTYVVCFTCLDVVPKWFGVIGLQSFINNVVDVGPLCLADCSFAFSLTLSVECPVVGLPRLFVESGFTTK